MEPKYIRLLQERKAKGSERSLLSFETTIDFWSNDYLGLGKQLQTIELSSGTGSRLISGNSQTIESVEGFLAQHFQSEAALVFNSGYDANLGLFSAVPQKGDTIIYDELVHASVRDGIRLSFAKAFSFKHNDLIDLENRLKQAEGSIFVAIESIYSMDGDLAPLESIATLCKQYEALLIVDEAHAGGVFGENGIGLCAEANVLPDVFARLVTFGKGFGAHGAVILGSEVLKSFLINFSRSFIYTTAMPEALYVHIKDQVLKAKNEALRAQLQANIRYFRSLIASPLSAENSPIQMLVYNDLNACIEHAKHLQEAGIAVKAILPPTVSAGQQRLRICLHAFNTRQEIDRLSELVQNYLC